MSGKRSSLANAVRGSMISNGKPAILAIGASAWLIWTAPITTRRGCGRCDIEEEAAALGFDRAGIAGAERLANRLAEIAGDGIAFADDAVAAVAEVGDENGSTARPALGIQGLECKRIHGLTPAARHRP